MIEKFDKAVARTLKNLAKYAELGIKTLTNEIKKNMSLAKRGFDALNRYAYSGAKTLGNAAKKSIKYAAIGAKKARPKYTVPGSALGNIESALRVLDTAWSRNENKNSKRTKTTATLPSTGSKKRKIKRISTKKRETIEDIARKAAADSVATLLNSSSPDLNSDYDPQVIKAQMVPGAVNSIPTIRLEVTQDNYNNMLGNLNLDPTNIAIASQAPAQEVIPAGYAYGGWYRR